MRLKILHILSALDQGGIEKWLLNLTAEIQRQYGGDVEFEFLTLFKAGGYYQSALERLDCRIHHCPLVWRNLPGFVRRLTALLRRGHYDVVHCHADYLSGLILPVARIAGVPLRVGHSHNTQFPFQARRPLIRHLAGRMLRRLQVMDGGWCLGTSSTAIDAYLESFRERMKCRVCLCGIPCADYRAAANTSKMAIRQSLKWGEDTKIVLHVGRHVEQKNLQFMVEILPAMLRQENNLLCVLAGSGPLTTALRARAEQLRIANRVVFLGGRDDVPQLMRAADLLLLPSLYEGLGLVVVEAQAVGLRSLVSNALPLEVNLVPGLVHRLLLEESHEVWADRAVQLLREQPADAESCCAMVEQSDFSITSSARELVTLYKKAATLP